jgi:hypothetical protein
MSGGYVRYPAGEYRAYPPAGQKERIPPNQWQEYSARTIAETIMACRAHDLAFVMRALLLEWPWFPYEREFKSVWMAEYEKQIAPHRDGWPGSLDTLPEELPALEVFTPSAIAPKPVKKVFPRDEWRLVSHAVIDELEADHLDARKPRDLKPEETHYKLVAQCIDMRAKQPLWEPESDPPESWTGSREAWRVENEEFQSVWFAVCAERFGYVINHEPVANQSVEPDEPVKIKQRQLTLF